MVGCDYCLIIAAPEQIPILKYRYGESFYDCRTVQVKENRLNLENLRPMALVYFSPSEKWSKIENFNFNVLNCIAVYRKAMKETFDLLGPSSFFLCLPWIVVNPQFLWENKEKFRQKLSLSGQQRLNFQFGIENDIDFPSKSHVYMRWFNIQNSWKKINEMYRTSSFSLINEMKLEDCIEIQPEKRGFFNIPREELFDLTSWKEYLRLMNKFDLESEKVSSIFTEQSFRLQANVPWLPKMRHFEDLQIMNDLKFIQFEPQRNFHRDYELWKKKRLKRIVNTNDGRYKVATKDAFDESGRTNKTEDDE